MRKTVRTATTGGTVEVYLVGGRKSIGTPGREVGGPRRQDFVAEDGSWWSTTKSGFVKRQNGAPRKAVAAALAEVARARGRAIE